MLEKLMKAYVMSMAYDVRSPMVHLVGPPGCGKSTFVEQLADLLGVQLHIINVSRLSPLEVEGVQMPHGVGEDMLLKMLPATYWSTLREGDILLMDEFLRGFPEVYSGLLDIFTSRRVGAFRLPKVFIVGASNSVVAYDQALEDRLLHTPVPDPRTNKAEKARIAKLIIDQLGLLPVMADSDDMQTLLDTEVLPLYVLLDSFKKKGTKSGPSVTTGSSVRNLIGQAQLRMVTSTALKELIDTNNVRAMQSGKYQYVLLLNGGKAVPNGYIGKAMQLRGNPKLTPVQALNLEANFQLIDLHSAQVENEEGNP
jgi:energy-coupling factor transporter ATP-binding protein EcfA2